MEKTKKCKYCQMEISKKAKVCPNCKRPLKSHGCLISILVVLIVLGTGISIVVGTVGENKAIQKTVSGVDNEDEYITMEEYNAIENGMTYDEVKEIVGSSGEVSSEVESNGTKIVIITWYGNGVAGSNANVTFTNDEVTGKAQVGLQ